MPERFIGLISGTSVNSIDAVLAEFDDTEQVAAPHLIASHEHPIPSVLKQQLLAFNQPAHNELDQLAQADNSVARLFAEAVHTLLHNANVKPEQVRAIGSHGQTIRHAPDIADPYTLQIGNPSLLVELTGITVIADFRRRDMAAGGQGAPLAPAFHAAFFRQPQKDIVAVNIGGIANVTLLPADTSQPVSGFDTGPGNNLLNGWINRHQQLEFDCNGEWAAGGQAQTELLDINF